MVGFCMLFTTESNESLLRLPLAGGTSMPCAPTVYSPIATLVKYMYLFPVDKSAGA